MANPRKPPSLKLVSGTDRPDRAVPTLDIPPLTDAPKAPAWVRRNEYALEEWDRLVPLLMANKLLTEVDLLSLAHACAMHGECVQMRMAGMPVSASTIGTLRNLLNDFGMSPVARGKVKPSDATPKANPFAAMRKGGKPA